MSYLSKLIILAMLLTSGCMPTVYSTKSYEGKFQPEQLPEVIKTIDQPVWIFTDSTLYHLLHKD